jgi:hypothetical protein
VAHQVSSSGEQFIGTVDVWELHQLRWPFLRVLARHFVETQELSHYERDLLTSGRWSRVRCSPHAGEAGLASTHLFDVYGMPGASAEARR